MSDKKPNYYDTAKCEKCSKTAKIDLKHLPTQKDRKLFVHYLCPNGHGFVREIQLDK